MQYTTIILELIQQRPELHQILQTSKTLLPTIQHHAQQLKTRHTQLIETLQQAQPDTSPAQIRSAALEIAVQELQETFQITASEIPEELSLDAAMTYLRRHTPPS